jgi:hypothetical protein
VDRLTGTRQEDAAHGNDVRELRIRLVRSPAPS